MLRKLRSVTCNIEEELKEIVNVCKEDEQVQSQTSEIGQQTNAVEREQLIVGNNQALQNSFALNILSTELDLSLTVVPIFARRWQRGEAAGHV